MRQDLISRTEKFFSAHIFDEERNAGETRESRYLLPPRCALFRSVWSVSSVNKAATSSIAFDAREATVRSKGPRSSVFYIDGFLQRERERENRDVAYANKTLLAERFLPICRVQSFTLLEGRDV